MTATLSRRCAAEFLGTFAIVFFGCGAIVTLQHQGAAPLMVNTVFGLVVAACVYTLGPISMAHFNPAVSIGFAVAKRFSWRDVPYYLVAQLLGAVCASSLHWSLMGAASATAHFGATLSAGPFVVSAVVEAISTFFLMLVIMGVATDERVDRAVPGMAIGMTVAFCGLFAGPISGCSLNPARSFGPALFAGSSALSQLWIYGLGPIVGAAIAAALYGWLGASPLIQPLREPAAYSEPLGADPIVCPSVD